METPPYNSPLYPLTRTAKADGSLIEVPYWLWFSLISRAALALAEDGCEGDAEGAYDGLDCSQTSACITEWCLPCAARAALREMARRGDECAAAVLEDVDEE